jgi:ABC-2 type transport system permease protein
MNSFVYLASTSARNRFLYQFKRARNPRYALALVFAGFYMWWFLVRPKSTGVGEIFLTRQAETIVTLLIVLMLSSAWVFGSDKLALAFTPAEVSLLFQAPLSRRALTGYKLYRAQVAVLINTLVWVFLLRRGNAHLPTVARALGIWVLFSTLNLHRLAAALVQSSWKEHGRVGFRRSLWSIAFFAFVAGTIIVGLVQGRAALTNSGDIGGFFLALTDVLARAPASWGLYPFHLVVAPSFAMTTVEWARAIPFAIVIVVAHLWWVLNADIAFEDAAIEASAERARRREASRSRRGIGVVATGKRASRTIALAAKGHPGLAIVWKNMLCLRRTAQWRLIVTPIAMGVAFGAAASEGGSDPALFVASGATAVALMLLTFGGRMIRNDLRHDMLNLPLLKALPIAPRDLLIAEVASSTLPMAAIQTAAVIVAFIASLFARNVPVPLSLRIAILVGTPFASLTLNGALLTIQNGLAVMFPAWMRLGSTVSTGVEALGQNLIATMASVLSLAFALIVPLVIGLIAVRYFMLSGAVATTATIIFASGVLALETYGVMQYLARVLGKAEPAAV